ncbi:transcription factor 23-like [Pelodytes ibericus]
MTLIHSPQCSQAESSSENYKSSQVKPWPVNAARERTRVRTLRQAFLSLQAALPSVPPDTKLSKLDVLVLASSYIAHLTQTLDQEGQLAGCSQISRGPGFLHPMKKWPMRSRLYAGVVEAEVSARCPSKKD